MKPRALVAADVLVVQTDGSMIPIRGDEPWKEAKVGIVDRHDLAAGAPTPRLLAAGNPDAIIAQVNACSAETTRRRDEVAANEASDGLVRYYTNNAERMEYAYYRARGFPIGTGAVESAHGMSSRPA